MNARKEYVFCDKYQPLFLPAKTRYVLVKGGRGSGKSHAVSSAVCFNTFDDAFNVLYTRFTMVSAETSIIPEYSEKIGLFGLDDTFLVRKSEIRNNATGAHILFRGLMTSSGNQIAKLKSLHNVKMWILDEAQELMDESMFDNIDLSVRTTEAQNVIMLVFNPTDINHWIYRRFYADLPDEDFNGTIGDVTYISTTYKDNLPNLSDSFLTQARKMQVGDPEKYDNIFLGHFARYREGLVYKGWEQIPDDQYPAGLPQWYGNDWGYSDDPDALVRMCYEPATGTLYLKEICYKSGMLARDVAHAILADAQQTGYRPEECIVYVDPARPEGRDELRIHYGINALSAVNRDKAGRVAWLRGFRVKYVGENIKAEVEKYSYKPQKADRSKYLDEPQDGNDHLMDAINYGAVTHLRAMGIENDYGEK